VELLATFSDFISVFGRDCVPLKSGYPPLAAPEATRVHHRGSEGTEGHIQFFVYREIPIDEKNLANQIHDGSPS
jgi:hypothetical protein